MITRRGFARGVAAAAAVGVIGGTRRAYSAAPAPKRPKAIIQILIKGGIDAIQCADAKAKKETAARVHRGYEDDDIVSVGDLRVGPMLGRMAAHVPGMAIINGINVATVAHDYGITQHRAGQRIVPRQSGMCLLGAIRSLDPGDPILTELVLAQHTRVRPTLGSLVSDPDLMPDGQTILSQLWQVSQQKGRWDAIDHSLREEISRCAEPNGCAAQDSSRRLLEGLSKVPSFPVVPKIPLNLTKAETIAKKGVNPVKLGLIDYWFGIWPTIIRDTLFALQHGITNCVYIMTPEDFDTHFMSDAQQPVLAANLFSALAVLLDALKTTQGPRGVPLADEVAVVMSSELGRYPALNALSGKDHFPEIPVFLMGPGLRPGIYGSTDELTVAQPISVATGRRVDDKDGFRPDLGDVGATILDWFGYDPVAVGYSGRRLDFVLA